MTATLHAVLERALGSRVVALQPAGGGDVNDAYRATLTSGTQLFVKTRGSAPSGMYACEAEGLVWLREAQSGLYVPDVVAVDEQLLVLPWIERGPRVRDFDEQLGRGLARLHRAGAPSFGFTRDNFIAYLPQRNEARASWSEFYCTQRLVPLVEAARARGLIDAALTKNFERLYARLSQLVGEPEPPARLHGDLWSGNVYVDASGAPVLIDPAVYGGHREIDLAMLQLFGAPSARFFAAYDELYLRAPGHAERVALYQLYPLLVHVQLFGSAYVAQLASAVARYL